MLSLQNAAGSILREQPHLMIRIWILDELIGIPDAAVWSGIKAK